MVPSAGWVICWGCGVAGMLWWLGVSRCWVGVWLGWWGGWGDGVAQWLSTVSNSCEAADRAL